MSETQKTIHAQAAHWVAQMHSTDCTDADLEAMTQWIEASEANRDAYAAALVLWSEIATQDEAPPAPNVVPLPVRKVSPAHVGAGIAAMAAMLVAGFLFLPGVLAPGKVYQTHIGDHQNLTLSDGTDLSLNTDTRVAVHFSDDRRTLTLERGEIAIDVGDKSHAPLTVVVGDVSIHDIGTQFNVSRLDGVVRVTVREGIVDMTSRDGTAQRLTAGHQGAFSEAQRLHSVKRIDPEPAFAWQSYRAIYQATPLNDVVRDLNRYYEKPIIVDGAAGDLRLSAILALDSQAAVTKRLADFLPIDVRTTDEAIHISLRGRTARSL